VAEASPAVLFVQAFACTNKDRNALKTNPDAQLRGKRDPNGRSRPEEIP
jgi:hypothetical protein